jgi:hypothetical protein
MKKSLRVFLVLIHFVAALTILVSQAETASDDFVQAKSPAAAHRTFQADAHSASDPHFSHAKKTGRDFEFSRIQELRFVPIEETFTASTANSGSKIIQSPRPPRSPPLV